MYAIIIITSFEIEALPSLLEEDLYLLHVFLANDIPMQRPLLADEQSA